MINGEVIMVLFHNGTGVVCSSTSGSEACPQIVNDKQMGNVLSFDGVDDYINLGNNDSLTFEGNFTISFWAYRTSEGYQGGTYIRKRGSSGIGFEMADSQFYLLSLVLANLQELLCLLL